MKETTQSLTLAMGLLMATASFNTAIADTKSGANANISGQTGAPAGFDIPALDTARAIFYRMHTLSIDTHVKNMKKDGSTERQYVAGFTASGAIAYDHEFDGRGLNPQGNIAGRNAGLQLVPYTIQLQKDGSTKIHTSIIGWKNMNANVVDDEMDDCIHFKYNKISDCGWRVFDNLELLSFDYNNDVARQIKDFRFSVINVDLKAALFKSDDDKFWIALRAGTSPFSLHATSIKNFEYDGSALDVSGYSAEFRYGAEFNYSSSNGWRIAGGLGFKNTLDQHYGNTKQYMDENQKARQKYDAKVEEYKLAVQDWQYEKERYEIEQGFKAPISDESYATITGNAKPKLKAKDPGQKEGNTSWRHNMVINPWLAVSKQLNPGSNNAPVRMGVTVEGTIPIEDKFKGEHKKNLLDTHNQGTMVQGSLFINW